MGYEAVLEALGDPTRRRIVDRLKKGPLPVGRIADGLPVSRPAVSKHLRVLEGCRLVTHEAAGTRNLYRLDRRGLDDLRRWVDDWDAVLDRFAEHVSNTRGKR